MLTYQPPYRGALRPLASLPEQDANTLARYLETRPHLAANPESIAWLVRRYTTRQQRHTDRPRTPLQPRPRAVTLPGNMNPLPAHIDPTPPNLLRGAAYLDDDDDEDVPLHPLEAHADTMVHIAELDPLNDHAADLRVIAPDADLPML